MTATMRMRGETRTARSSRRSAPADSFLTLLNAIGSTGVFFLYAFLTLVALVYFNAVVPETKGRSLQEIERELDPELAAAHQ